MPAGPSTSRENGEYSIWTAVTGAILTARRTAAEVTVDSPMCLILPSLRDSESVMSGWTLF